MLYEHFWGKDDILGKYSFDYYKDNFEGKFLSLLDIQYSNIPHNKRRETFYCDYENSYYADIRKTAKNWFRTDYSKRTVPALNVLINICDILHCDIDYFLTNQTEYNSDISLVSGITGLTFQSVENLIGRNHNINMQSLSTLNYLLGEDPQRGFNFLFLLYQYLFGNYQKIRGLQGDHIEFVDDTDFNGTAIEITNLNSLFKSMVETQLQKIKAAVDSDSRWNTYGKYIPSEDEAQKIIKELNSEIDKGKKNLNKFKSDQNKIDFWQRYINERKTEIKKYEKYIKSKPTDIKQNEKDGD